ncbi:MAG: hypothetical protein Q7T82_10645 [Armatimonadota bacterium]|nr:hypothetical protein [Armatimonadota bacterium]
MISVLSAVAVAGVLYAVLWQQVGSFYYLNEHDPTSRLVHLHGHLMIGLFVISFAAGLAAGLIEAGGRLKRPVVRGSVAAVVFGILAFAITIVGPLRIFQGLGQSTVTSIVLYAALAVFVLLLMGAFASSLLCIIAAAGAEIGDAVRRRSPKLAFGACALACCAALVPPIVQGRLLRQTVQAFDQVKPVLEARIDRNLVAIRGERKWRLGMRGDFPPTIEYVSLRLPNGGLHVGKPMDSIQWHAIAHFTAPRDMRSLAKADALAFLRAHGIRESRLSELRGKPSSGWSSWTGRYRVSMAGYDPRYRD